MTNLKQERAKLVADARQIHDQAEKEARDLTAEENARFSAIMSDVEKYGERIAQADKLEAIEASLKESQGRISRPQEVIPTKELKRFSVLKAMRESLAGGLTGFEKEVNQELTTKYGKAPQGFYIPANMPNLERYDLTTTTGTGAVNVGVLFDQFIDLIRNRLVIQAMGCRMLTDLVGNFTIPKQSGAATASWIAESAAVTPTDSTIAQIALSPKTIAASTQISRKFILQSGLDAEAFVRNDLAAVIALEIDRAALNGSGASNQPLGILQNSSCPTVAIGTNGGAATYANLLSLEQNVSGDRSDIQSVGFVTSARGRASLKGTPRVSGYPSFLMGDDGSVLGYRSIVSNQIPSNLTKGSGTNLTALIMGIWSDLIIGMWGATDVIVDPYSGATSGNVRIAMLQDCDVQVRNAVSFSKIVDLA
jgi:HK97 family phage major capsid protein